MPSPPGIDYRRHSGESRNPEPIRIKMLRSFMFSSLVWEKAKSKNEKTR